MVHCDNNYIVVSGLAKDFLWEVSGCCCDDASLKLGGGPSLNSWTVCFMWKQGVFFSPSVTHIAYSWTYMYFYIHTNTHRDIPEWKKLTEPTECLAKDQLRVFLHFSYTLHTWAKRLRSCELCTSALGFELSCASLLFCHCFARVSIDPWRSTISATQTQHTYAGQPAALFPYCLPFH